MFPMTPHSDLACIPTTVIQLYPHLSKVIYHQLKYKALRIYRTLASQRYSFYDLLFLTARSAALISKKQYRQNPKTKSQFVSYAQVASSAKNYEK